MGYPKEFPDTNEVRIKKQEDADFVSEGESVDLSMIRSAKKLLGNRLLMLVYVAVAFERATMVGLGMFFQKILHIQFHFTEGEASMITGLIIIPGASLGTFLGGYLVKRFNWNCKDILRFSTFVALLSTLLMAVMLVGCGNGEATALSAGHLKINKTNWTATSSNTSQLSCRAQCDCTEALFKPICTENDQTTFYSPCHAGCFKHQSKDNEYFNCSCFADDITKAVEGSCSTEWCPLFLLFAVGFIVSLFFTYLNNAPLLIISLRLVDSQHQTLALGVREILTRLIGEIPGPIILGAMIDSSCDLWKQGDGEEDMNCLVYDYDYMRYYTFAFSFIPKFAMFVLILVAARLYQLPPVKVTEGGAEGAAVVPNSMALVTEEQPSRTLQTEC